ncbi:hypothetical protein Trydic_g23867 [Trypoxylus dichotomus]
MSDISYRTQVAYKNLSSRFSRKNDDYNNQFFKIYNVRLDRMTKYLLEAIKKKWGEQYPICKLYKLSEENDDICIVIGTLFKDQKLKPSILKQLAESNQLMPQPILNRFTDETDLLYIEDELQRFQLEGVLNREFVVTGITCALLGRDKGDGKFEVIDYTFANYRPQIEKPIIENDVYVVLLSGLDLSHLEKSSLSIRLLVNWLSGFLGDINGVCTTEIARVIIAGNSVKTASDDGQMKFTMSVHSHQKNEVVDAIKTLDMFLLELCQVIDVDLMPGCNDPSNFVLPQKSLHHYLVEPIDALENCLKWNHMAPTAPDTLACYPYYDNDPFIVEDCPHVFFAGNQKKFETKLVAGSDGQVIRLVCVPEFSSSFTAAILNLRNLECTPITFRINYD